MSFASLKRRRQSPPGLEESDHVEVVVLAKDSHERLPTMKNEKERQRQKKKKKRQKAEKQSRDEEHRLMMEERAKQAEVESSEAGRFLVGIPLTSVSGLAGGSVCRHFRKRDLVLNSILPVSLETLLASLPARSLYHSLKGPIYFVCTRLFTSPLSC